MSESRAWLHIWYKEFAKSVHHEDDREGSLIFCLRWHTIPPRSTLAKSVYRRRGAKSLSQANRLLTPQASLPSTGCHNDPQVEAILLGQ